MEKMMDYYLPRTGLAERSYDYDQGLRKETARKKENQLSSENNAEIGEHLTATYLG